VIFIIVITFFSMYLHIIAQIFRIEVNAVLTAIIFYNQIKRKFNDDLQIPIQLLQFSVLKT